jgi:hypothetical protein
MPEKPAKKTVTIGVKRERRETPKIVVATGFRLRPDKVTGMIELLLETRPSQRGERIILDPIVLVSNLDEFKRYAARLSVAEDNAAQKDDILFGETSTFANMIYFSQMGARAETAFAAFSVSDWVEATRQTKGEVAHLSSYDTLVAMSTVPLQKKLVLELSLMLTKPEQE